MTQPDGSSNPLDPLVAGSEWLFETPGQGLFPDDGLFNKQTTQKIQTNAANWLSGGGVGGAVGDALTSKDNGGDGPGIFEQITDALADGLAPLKAIQAFGDNMAKLFIPTNIVRAVAAILGAFFLLFGIGLLVREVRR